MSKLLIIYCAQLTLKQFEEMEGTMSSPCFSVTSPNSKLQTPNSNPYRLVQFFVFNFIYVSNIFCSCLLSILKYCRLYNVFGYGRSHGMYAQFIAQANAFNYGKQLVHCKVKESDMQHGST